MNDAHSAVEQIGTDGQEKAQEFAGEDEAGHTLQILARLKRGRGYQGQ